jgi:hypothetical protein
MRVIEIGSATYLGNLAKQHFIRLIAHCLTNIGLDHSAQCGVGLGRSLTPGIIRARRLCRQAFGNEARLARRAFVARSSGIF